MSNLVNQPSNFPTKEVTWQTAATMITGAAIAIGDNYYSFLTEPEVTTAILTLVPAGVGFIVAYFKRDEKNA